MPAIPSSFPELGTLNDAALRRLLEDNDAVETRVMSIPGVKEMRYLEHTYTHMDMNA
jgi:hypothetical protein